MVTGIPLDEHVNRTNAEDTEDTEDIRMRRIRRQMEVMMSKGTILQKRG